MIYFDNNATTPLAPEVIEIYLKALEKFGNPSSAHQQGREARRLLNEAREKIAAVLQVSESSLVFTSGGTESLNAALLGTFLPLAEKRHLIVSQVEHPAVLETAKFLASWGVEVSYLTVDAQGALDPRQLEAALRPDTGMIAVMFANNETGNLYPIQAIGEIARAHGIPYLCDAVQAVGKIPIDLSRLSIDFSAASAHKFHGPKGVGLLYIHPSVNWNPLFHGGKQERGRRAGTENVAGIVAMAQAFGLAQENMSRDQRKIALLRDKLQAGLLEKIPGLIIHGDLEHRLPNTLNFRIPGISGESALINLDQAGISIGFGSACESGSLEGSHVLRAMGLSQEQAMGGLRISLSRYNTKEEVDRALKIIPKVIDLIRRAA